MAEMENGALVIDDISQFETERLIEIYRPDIVCAGIKEKYAIQKSGVPMKQLHSYDSGGPYAGFQGAINFYREIDRMVNSKVWKYPEGALAGESRAGRQICLGMNDTDLFSSPLMGEGRVGVNKPAFNFLPLPPTPSHQGRGRQLPRITSCY